MDDLIFNFDDVRNFLDMLGGSETQYAWRILPGGGGVPTNHYGSLGAVSARLSAANRQGAGVFLTVNETDGCGAKAENIKAVRAIFADMDGAPIEPILAAKPKPHMIVESSQGKYHAYWRVDDCPPGQFKAIQRAIAEKFDGDPAVNDLPRVMRVPGFYHQKSEPVLTTILQHHDAPPYKLQQIIDGLSLELNANPEPMFANRGAGSAKNRADISKPLKDGERTGPLLEFIGRYIGWGLDDTEILCELREWNANNIDPLPDEKLVGTLKSIRRRDDQRQAANDPAIADLNQKHAIVLLGGKTVVARDDGTDVNFMTVDSFTKYHANLPPIDGSPAANVWIRHPERRGFRRVVFDPAGDAANDEYNLWRGFACKPKEGDCSLYLAHIRDNIANGDKKLYEYLLDFMADSVQNPARLSGVALALRGQQGTGKGVFISQFGAVFGRHFVHVQTSDHLTGKFNTHLKEAVLVFADEVVWGGDKRQEGVLKALVTEPTRFVEPKGKDPFPVKNCVRLMMATNNDWAVPAGMEERRFCVLDVGNGHRQDRRYFRAIVDQMSTGGREALLHMLFSREISDVDIGDFPKTDALLDQKLHSLNSVEGWWYDCLAQGTIGFRDNWPDELATSQLFSAYEDAVEKERFARNVVGNESALGRAFKKVAPDVKKIRTQENGVRTAHYQFPSLDRCRESFEAALGHKINWED